MREVKIADGRGGSLTRYLYRSNEGNTFEHGITSSHCFARRNAIPREDLGEIHHRNNANDLVGGSTLGPLDVLEAFQSSFNFTEWQIFRSAMIEDAALMVGSSCMAALGFIDVALPNRLDILVGRERGKAVHSALRNFG